MIFRNHSLYPSNIYKQERNKSTLYKNFLLLVLSAMFPINTSIKYGNLMAANTNAICGKERLLAIDIIGIKINPT